MKKIFSILILSLIVSGTLISATPAFGETVKDRSYVPLAPLPDTGVGGCTPGQQSGCKVTLDSYLSGIFKGAIAVAGVLSFLMIVIGGFQYMSTDAISGKSEGKEKILRAVGGLLLALSSYLILSTINTDLVKLDLTFGGKVPVRTPGLEAGKGPAKLTYTETLYEYEYSENEFELQYLSPVGSHEVQRFTYSTLLQCQQQMGKTVAYDDNKRCVAKPKSDGSGSPLITSGTRTTLDECISAVRPQLADSNKYTLSKYCVHKAGAEHTKIFPSYEKCAEFVLFLTRQSNRPGMIKESCVQTTTPTTTP